MRWSPPEGTRVESTSESVGAISDRRCLSSSRLTALEAEIADCKTENRIGGLKFLSRCREFVFIVGR
ncbi:hypothetical protein EYF80_041005 [Liparis tanakae]|uniref:Uncharacterized protein n=1 Tax=Liparis tanakae TaxID=230148 RepID=A0A4Z2G5B9_9TELE|nr:hypothetical protein EYF80_041005 [Liparis tanakae]